MAERDVRLAAQLLAQRPEQARFADAGLARQQHHLAIAVFGPAPALEQDAELVLASDQRRERPAMQRLEAAFGADPRLRPARRRERLGEALEAYRAEIGQLEQAADQAARRLADDDTAPAPPSACSRAARFGRLADHRLLLRRALADQVADHDQAGRDPDPCRRACARRCASSPHRFR